MNLLSHAENELDRIGLTVDSQDEMDAAMCKHILHMIQQFADQGHSGFSASYAISLLTKLMQFKPLSPLTGEDDEWSNISEYSGQTSYQNKRLSSVFKDGDGSVYDIDGKVFWEWNVDEDSKPYKFYYSNRDCSVPVVFPYSPPDRPIYEYRCSDADPSAPPQTEQGLI